MCAGKNGPGVPSCERMVLNAAGRVKRSKLSTSRRSRPKVLRYHTGMEVHAPHEPIHSWRDFFIHIVTITIGLLIALGLEAAVEALHHRHLRQETRQNLRAEIQDNQRIFAKDMSYLVGETAELKDDIALLQRLRARQQAKPGETLHFAWGWDGTSDTAWQTAKDTGALGLMDIQAVQQYDGVYSQQDLVDRAALELTRDMTKATIPLTVEPDLNALTPAQIDELIRGCAANLNQIQYVQALSASVLPNYRQALDKL